jgi:hypothetical protein
MNSGVLAPTDFANGNTRGGPTSPTFHREEHRTPRLQNSLLYKETRSTRNPASTRTFAAIADRLQIFLLVCAEVGRKSVHRTDEVCDRNERCRSWSRPGGRAGQALADDVGFGKSSSARFAFDLRDQPIRQPDGQCFHNDVCITQVVKRQDNEVSAIMN